MKFIPRFFLILLLILPNALMAAGPMAGTAGNNLTAFNGNIGAQNNNNWNQAMNPGKSVAPAADFGNCNALILRCAQPKCATGGCITMDIAYPIVNGCVSANASCKGYGEDLTNYIAAQLVATSTAKAADTAAVAAANSSAAAAAQSSEQMAAMQNQMAQMQSQMASAGAESTAAVVAALDEQKKLIAAGAAGQQAAQITAIAETKTAIEIANGVSADVLAREQASGQIMSKLENAEVSLKTLKKTMQNAFDYAGCDSSGNNCSAPKRIKAFKDKSREFFEPYENTLDEVYDSLIMAQTLGVDITDIYMMLNGSCNVWGKYMCSDKDQDMHYTIKSCKNRDGASFATSERGAKCIVGQVIPMADGGCQLIQMMNNNEEVQQNWLYPESGEESKVRIGCASEALDNSKLFAGRKKQATIDIETLQRIIEQDAPSTLGVGKNAADSSVKFCSVPDKDELEKLVSLKKLPAKVCVTDNYLTTRRDAGSYTGGAGVVVAPSVSNATSMGVSCDGIMANSAECLCNNSPGGKWNISSNKCECTMNTTLNSVSGRCESVGADGNKIDTTFKKFSISSEQKNVIMGIGGL